MVQAKRGPKAKSKDVEQVSEPSAFVKDPGTEAKYLMEERMRAVWYLAANILEARVKQSTTVHPAAITEIANQAKLLANEVYGPF